MNLSEDMNVSGRNLSLLLKTLAEKSDSLVKLTAIDNLRFELLEFQNIKNLTSLSFELQEKTKVYDRFVEIIERKEVVELL